jgi:colicin import membrane protein
MAERQETSVMVSIQEILRDAQHREEQEKVEADRKAREDEQRRLDDIRRKQEEEEARLRSEEEDRQRRAYEEQRRQAEIQAMQEAAVQRARAEAEAQARLAEMAARQEHERQLHALSQDKHKKRLTFIIAGLAAFFVIGGIGAGVVIKNASDKTAAAEAQLRALQDEKDKADEQQARLKAELENTKDPEKIAALQQQLAEQQAKLQTLNTQIAQNKGGGGAVVRPAGGGGGGGASKPAGPAKPCNCTPGDPLCSCL